MLDADIPTADAVAQLHVAEPGTDAVALDRRRFLQLVGMGVGAGLVAGGAGSLLDAFAPGSATAWATGPIGPNDGVIVVLGMFGGNDGLNTVVPLADPRYHELHGPLAIPAATAIQLDGQIGLNPELTELHRFWDRGELAIVEGIGYPSPDLSHFNSMAYWMAGRPHAIPASGWLGRWLDGHLGGSRDLYAAAEIGSSVPLHLVGASARGTAVPPGRPAFGADTGERYQRQYQAMRDMRSAASGPWFESVSQTFVDTIDLAQTLAPVIPATLPSPSIVARLEVAARLINANLGFRVLTAGWGDFDSHAGQPGQHTARMEELNAAIARFFEVLDPAWASRVTMMTFSEFGRTPWSNDGAGTDHGTSAPHFVLGSNVRGGRYGQAPSLAGLGRWDRMAHHVDFRSYYASIIDGWMGGGAGEVLGGTFENLGLFARAPGVAPPPAGTPGPSGPVPVQPAPAPAPGAGSAFVPLTPARIADTRTGTGGVPVGPVPAGDRIRVAVRGTAGVPRTGATAVVANVTAVDATTPMFLTVHPGGTKRPGTSNINGGPGRPVPNLVVTAIGDDGFIEVFNSHGATHCLVDVFGYFTSGSGDRFTALAPQRLFDTRDGVGVRRGKLGHEQPIDIQVAGRAGVPPSGATAVVMNLAAVEPETPGFLRLTPTGERPATTSNVNFFAGDVVPNLVICKLGTGGRVTLDAAGRATHALGDVFGYFGPVGSGLQPIGPRRVLDTRDGTGSTRAPVGPDHTVRLELAGRTVPAGATAVVLNVAATNVVRPSFVAVWPHGEPAPGTSNLNLMPGQTIANLVICRLGSDGALAIGNPIGDCDVLADVLGYFVE